MIMTGLRVRELFVAVSLSSRCGLDTRSLLWPMIVVRYKPNTAGDIKQATRRTVGSSAACRCLSRHLCVYGWDNRLAYQVYSILRLKSEPERGKTPATPFCLNPEPDLAEMFYGHTIVVNRAVFVRGSSTTAPQITHDSSGVLNPAGDGDSDDGLEQTAGSNNDQRPEVDGDGSMLEAGRQELEDGGVGGGRGGEGGEGEDDQGADGEEPKAEEPPFPKGSFFFKVDDKDKGHYKVRDVSNFLLTSMYKRKDRVTRTAGVSLLVGKLEEPPHEEKVISALFDTDRFTERAAAEWWEDNGHRFEDARSLAEKKVREKKNRSIDRSSMQFVW